jgi:hypothetical protein
MSKYPEHEKLQALGGKNQTVGDFIEWLGQCGIVLAEFDKHDDLRSAHKSRDHLIAEFFELNLSKLEAEKRQMLDDIRAKQS